MNLEETLAELPLMIWTIDGKLTRASMVRISIIWVYRLIWGTFILSLSAFT